MNASLIGTSKWDLDTPALCIDLDVLDANIARMQAFAAAHAIGVRPHAKSHKCAQIAERQLSAGAIGICVATVSEAEAFVAAGIGPILLTTAQVGRIKIGRSVALAARDEGFIQSVDSERGARELDAAAAAAGVIVDVVIDVAVGTRTGVPPGAQALDVAKLADRLPRLRLRGLLSYDGHAQHIPGYDQRRRKALENLEASIATRDAMNAAGLSTEIFSGGGTGTFDIYASASPLTDLQVGSYALMDTQYLAIGGRDGGEFTEFAPSLTILTTVLNDRFPGLLTTDAGAKTVGIDEPGATVVGDPALSYDSGSDEFGVITLADDSPVYRIGDRLELIPPHCDPAVNLYDRMHVTRGDRVVDVWEVTARGCSQ